jgi:hypothetical protein
VWPAWAESLIGDMEFAIRGQFTGRQRGVSGKPCVAADLREIRVPVDFGCGARLSVFGGGL